jgi:hypothetical protein
MGTSGAPSYTSFLCYRVKLLIAKDAIERPLNTIDNRQRGESLGLPRLILAGEEAVGGARVFFGLRPTVLPLH